MDITDTRRHDGPSVTLKRLISRPACRSDLRSTYSGPAHRTLVPLGRGWHRLGRSTQYDRRMHAAAVSTAPLCAGQQQTPRLLGVILGRRPLGDLPSRPGRRSAGRHSGVWGPPAGAACYGYLGIGAFRAAKQPRYCVYCAAMDYAVFSDESRHTEGRYRSLAAVSLPAGEVVALTELLRSELQLDRYGELKWRNVRRAWSRDHAIAAVDVLLAHVASGVRADVLTWDTQDSRHDVRTATTSQTTSACSSTFIVC